MEYYFNLFNVVVKNKDSYEFPEVENIESSFKFNSIQENKFLKLMNGEKFSKKDLEDIFGKELIESWIENSILINMPIDDKAINSRSISYYWHKKMGNVPKVLIGKTVLIMGCGGIGSHVAWNLTALGVGKIYLVDYDKVEVSNLNRQILYSVNDAGKYKVDVLKEKLQDINPYIKIEAINKKVSSEEDIKELIKMSAPSCIVKSMDSPIYFPKWLDKVCREENIKYVSGILAKTSQMIGPTFIPNESACYTDFFDIYEDKERLCGIGPSLSFVMYQLAGEISEEVFKILVGKGKLKYKNKIVIHENLSDETVTLKPKKFLTQDKEINYKTSSLVSILIIVLIYFLGIVFKIPQQLIQLCAILYVLLEPIYISHNKKEILSTSFNNAVFMVICNMMLVYNNGGFSELDRGTIISFISIMYIFLSIFMLLFCLIEIGFFNIKKYFVLRRRKKND